MTTKKLKFKSNILTYNEHIEIMSKALDIQKYQLKIDMAKLKRKTLINATETLKDYIEKDLYQELLKVFDWEIIRMQKCLDWMEKNNKSEIDYIKSLSHDTIKTIERKEK